MSSNPQTLTPKEIEKKKTDNLRIRLASRLINNPGIKSRSELAGLCGLLRHEVQEDMAEDPIDL